MRAQIEEYERIGQKRKAAQWAKDYAALAQAAAAVNSLAQRNMAAARRPMAVSAGGIKIDPNEKAAAAAADSSSESELSSELVELPWKRVKQSDQKAVVPEVVDLTSEDEPTETASTEVYSTEDE
jgi:hypothetical protein